MDPANAATSALGKTEGWLYFDPRTGKGAGAGVAGLGPDGRPLVGGPSFGVRRMGFQEAVVGVVGGGGMEEYGNLQEWAGKKVQGGAGRRRVVYGATEMVGPERFLGGEVRRLGEDG